MVIKIRTNKRIEPISDSDLLREQHNMGQTNIVTINRIKPLSGDPLSGFDSMYQVWRRNFARNFGTIEEK